VSEGRRSDTVEGVLSGLSGAEPDPYLVAQGWERRFVADRQRAVEVADLYRQSGFEVRLEVVRSDDLPDGCTDCRLVELLGLATVYTRRTAPSP